MKRSKKPNADKEPATAPNGDIQPTAEDTHALIGKLLVLTQDTEEQLSWVLRIVFKDGVITAEDLERKDKKTLGRLVQELRTKMQVEQSFEKLLLIFVEQRNLFIHKLRSQAWFDLSSNENINQVWHILGKYMANLEQIALTFTAYITRFADQVGAPKDQSWDQLERSGFLRHLREVYYPRLGRTLRRRPEN
jgi:hypothetical protein